MADHPLELAEVFRAGFDEYNAQHGPLPGHCYGVVNALLACHTSALGGHVYRCESCGHQKMPRQKNSWVNFGTGNSPSL
jgi:hypothetical protein